MRNKIIAALVAGGLLVGAGLVSAAASAPAVASAQEDSAQEDSAENEGRSHRGMNLLSEVLDDLVDDGTISQDQADAVTDALEAKVEEIKAQREALREMVQEFLGDGVITADEAAQLPEDNPFNDEAFDEAWEDGELTIEEIREIKPKPGRQAFKRGIRFGALLDDGGIDAEEWADVVADLPQDHPLADFDVSEYLEDGVITVDELREIHETVRNTVATDSTA
jgi:polyhydroxyalkanoate synthesis regulator phasin